jgi:hypothetical protein
VVWYRHKYGEVNSKFTELGWDSRRVSEAGSEEDKILHSKFEVMLMIGVLSSLLALKFSSLFPKSVDETVELGLRC